MEDKGKFAITRQGIKLMLVGLVVIVSGFVLLAGPKVQDPAVFNYDMFDFKRLVAAPIVILCGLVIEVVAIMKRPK